MENRKENTDELIESLFLHLNNVLNDEDLKYLQMLSQKYYQLEHENILFKSIYKAAKIIGNITEREAFLYNIQAFSFFLLLKNYPQYLNQTHTDNKIPWKLLFIWTNTQYNYFHDRLIKNIPNLTVQQQKQLCLFRIGFSNDKIAHILQKSPESVRVEKARLLKLLMSNPNPEVSRLASELKATKLVCQQF